ncbi:hypothetical protein DPMN_156647 [Dreissena polymorpha]|uniref:Uncharacterized protein n=1 Tax=Dreissena polymorpha TaxID=45954 RepID=A0A9D4FSP7_DREPO|nr:hypothetical protein DPMN_156647 [Dreissena polymorpha]
MADESDEIGKSNRSKQAHGKDIDSEKKLVASTKKGDYNEVESLLNLGVSVDATEYNRQLFYQSENYMTPP